MKKYQHHDSGIVHAIYESESPYSYYPCCLRFSVSKAIETIRELNDPEEITCGNCRRAKLFKEWVASRGIVKEGGPTIKECLDAEAETVIVQSREENREIMFKAGGDAWDWQSLLADSRSQRLGWVCPVCRMVRSPDVKECCCADMEKP